MEYVNEQLPLPRGLSLKEFGELIAGLFSRVRIQQLTLDSKGIIQLRREVRSTDSQLPEMIYLNPEFRVYDRLGSLTEVSLPPAASLREAAIAALDKADELGVVPCGYLAHPDLCRARDFRARRFGVLVVPETRCGKDRLVLLCGLDPQEGLPSATTAIFAPFPESTPGGQL